MKIDPKLLKRLEERPDANRLLAEALGVCPTCGQLMPEAIAGPGRRRTAAGNSKREAILEWRRNHEGASQNACARALQVSQAYVGRVWNEADEHGEGFAEGGESPRESEDGRGE